MKLLPIRFYPDPILNQRSEPVTRFDNEEQEFFDAMIETMLKEDGVGLAAPQVGVLKRVIAVSPSMKKDETYILVNPEIEASWGQQSGIEGCLSFPGISAEILRARKIRLRYQDRHGVAHSLEAQDLFARIIQHETDHLNGVLFIDRLNLDKRLELLTHLQRA